MTSRQKLRRALIDLNHPRHDRAVEWVHEPSSFTNRVRRPVRTRYGHEKRRAYRASPKRKQSSVIVELLAALAAAVSAAILIRQVLL